VVEMHAASDHMKTCAECQIEYRKLENTRLMVASLGRKPAPADLALKIRVALSRERSRTWQNLLQGYMVRLEDAVNAFMFPATAGGFKTIFFFWARPRFFFSAPPRGAEFCPSRFFPAPPQS